MSEEIKEILEEIRIIIYYNEIQNIYKETQLDYDSSKKLLNYITNLQKENENLLYEINGYLKEKEKLKEKINKLEDYKQRNEKTVEYIKNKTKEINFDNDKLIDVLNILEDGDE